MADLSRDAFRPLSVPQDHPTYKELTRSIDLYYQIGEEFHAGPSSTEYGVHIVYAHFVRCCRLYRSVLSLVADGFGPEAESLSRSMHETALNAFWALTNREEAEERFRLHVRYTAYLWRQNTNYDSENPEEVQLELEELARAKKLFGTYGELPWTGQKLKTLERAVVTTFDQAADGNLQTYFSGTHRWLNWSIHGSPVNLFRPTEVTERMRVFNVVPSRLDLLDALQCAHDQFVLAIGIMMMFLETEPSRKLTTRLWDVWRCFTPGAEEAGRNDPCPCGSGAKYKRCHLP